MLWQQSVFLVATEMSVVMVPLHAMVPITPLVCTVSFTLPASVVPVSTAARDGTKPL